MVMKAFKKKPHSVDMARKESLAYTPVKNVQVTEKRLETGDVLLTYPAEVRPWFAGLVRRLGGPSGKTYTKKIQLDTLGTAVWEMMDGKRTVRQLIRKFAKHHQLHTREAEVAVTQFIRDLGKRGVIGLR
jgi:hypothetical protein